MSYADGGNSAGPEQTPSPPPDPAVSAPGDWLVTLNSVLEHAFLKADVDTGC